MKRDKQKGVTETLAKQGSITFEAVQPNSTFFWRVPTDFSFAPNLGWVPLSDTEFLHTAHHFPLAVVMAKGKPVLCAVLADGVVQAPFFNAAGILTRAYTPIALRCMPFRLVSKSGANRLEIATGIGLDRQESGYAVGTPEGAWGPETQKVIATIRRLNEGRKRLSLALERLILADLIAPLQIEAGSPFADVFHHLDQERFLNLDPLKATALVRQDFLSAEIAGALLFSRRHLVSGLDIVRPQGRKGTGGTHLADIDMIVKGYGELEIALDDSQLFPVDAFLTKP